MPSSACKKRDRKSTRLNSSHTLISYAVFCLTKKSSDRKSTRLNSSHTLISYDVFCLKKKKAARRERHQRHVVQHEAEGVQRDEGGDHRIFYQESGDHGAPPSSQEQDPSQ